MVISNRPRINARLQRQISRFEAKSPTNRRLRANEIGDLGQVHSLSPAMENTEKTKTLRRPLVPWDKYRQMKMDFWHAGRATISSRSRLWLSPAESRARSWPPGARRGRDCADDEAASSSGRIRRVEQNLRHEKLAANCRLCRARRRFSAARIDFLRNFPTATGTTAL